MNVPVDIVALATANEEFRKVVKTSERTQIVLMRLPPGKNIGEEIHEKEDQLFLFVVGNGFVVLNGVSSPVSYGKLAQVPAGTKHDVKATTDLRFVSIYSPPVHAYGTVHHTKEEAEKAEEADAY